MANFKEAPSCQFVALVKMSELIEIKTFSKLNHVLFYLSVLIRVIRGQNFFGNTPFLIFFKRV